jgi:hypothetical protein
MVVKKPSHATVPLKSRAHRKRNWKNNKDESLLQIGLAVLRLDPGIAFYQSNLSTAKRFHYTASRVKIVVVNNYNTM